MKTFLVIFIGRLASTASAHLEDYSYQPIAEQLPDYEQHYADYHSSGLADQLAEKRGAGKWKMRMFKREPGEDLEEDFGVPVDSNDEGLEMSKRGRQWKMRMFKKRQPWKMRMFKRLPYKIQSELDKKSPWKMRMFKRLSMERTYGKRPDKWQMRMFKRDPELGQETPGDSLR